MDIVKNLSALPLQVSDVAAARARILAHVPPSPIDSALSLGPHVWLKLDCLLPTHSFKVRGALNAMLSLDDDAKARGVIAASTGNHAQGIAYAARLSGVSARIVMPTNAARRKIAGVEHYGGQPILFGASYDDAETEARRIERDEGLTYLSPYNDVRVAAGQGVCGLELIEQVPTVERVIVPIGGGGLISGIAVALKSVRPDIEIIGVNAAVSPEMYNFFYAQDRPCSADTLADALPGMIESGSITLEITRALVDQIVLVSERQISDAMRWLKTHHDIIGEGGGVVGIAAVLGGVIPLDKQTVIVVSGGNVDEDVLARVLTT